jgi:hypothetical protein
MTALKIARQAAEHARAAGAAAQQKAASRSRGDAFRTDSIFDKRGTVTTPILLLWVGYKIGKRLREFQYFSKTTLSVS